MVKFRDENTTQAGPCKRVAQDYRDTIIEMVRMTENNNKEYGIGVKYIEGQTGATEIAEGNEDSIDKSMKVDIDMDLLMVLHELDKTVHEETRYFLHTHPAGHLGFSLADMLLLSKETDPDMNADTRNHALLIAVQSGGDIVIQGIYETGDITEEEAKDLKRDASLVRSKDIRMSHEEKKRTMVTSLQEAGYKFCEYRMEGAAP